MSLTSAFYEAMQSGNVVRVRIMMKNSLLSDPSFAEFAEMERAAASMAGLYDQYDGGELISDKSQWTNSYMDQLMVKLISNFSPERINHLKEIVRYLVPVPERTSQSHDYSASSNGDEIRFRRPRPKGGLEQSFQGLVKFVGKFIDSIFQ